MNSYTPSDAPAHLPAGTKDDYKDFPQNGEDFTENEITYYWNQSHATPGTQIRSKRIAWASTGQVETKMITEPIQFPCLGSSNAPVSPVTVCSPGFFYEIDRWATAVENRFINGHYYTKWRDEYLSGGAAQSSD